jgi:hypothetical protein
MAEPYAWQAVGGTIWTSEDNRPPLPEWQGLTESEMGQLIHDHCQPSKTYRSLMDFAIDLNNCLKRKNT